MYQLDGRASSVTAVRRRRSRSRGRTASVPAVLVCSIAWDNVVESGAATAGGLCIVATVQQRPDGAAVVDRAMDLLMAQVSAMTRLAEARPGIAALLSHR